MITRRLVFLLALLCLVGVGFVLAGAGVGAAPATPNPQSMLGINFIGSAEMAPRPARFQRGADSGAGWDRWVLYWSNIERSKDGFDWSGQDAAFLADASVGLNVHAVLLTTPDFYARAGVVGKDVPRVDDKGPYLRMLSNALAGNKTAQQPTNCAANTYPPTSLGEPVFVMQGGQRAVNSANRWAWFVYQAVKRYKPGGDLAQARGLADVGIRSWEIWNEPDFACVFFSGTPQDYYAMLKVAYQAIKFADPSATVVFGGLTYWGHEGFFDDFLAALATDPDKNGQSQNHFYFDALALHWYSNSRNALYQSQAFANKLQQNGMAGKPIWLTESGVPILGDAVGPPDPATPLLGTIDDQANFIIQNFAYARWLSAEAPSATDRVFHFQMYDDGIAGAFGPFGLVRNPDHPTAPDTLRPAYAAFQTVARYLDGATPISGSRDTRNGIERMSFRHPNGARVTVMWNWNSAARTISVRASASSALLVDHTGGTTTITPSGGNYSMTLPGATNFNQIGDPNNAMIGGATYLLVEGNAFAPTAVPTNTPTATRVPPTATPIPPTATPSPTMTPTPVPSCVNLIANSGFDQSSSPWALSGRRAVLTGSGHTGLGLFLGLLASDTATNPGGDMATASQSVQVPANAASARLSFWAYTGHAPGADANDSFRARVVDANGGTVVDIPLTVDSNAWQSYSVSLAPYLAAIQGRTIRVEFSVSNAPTAGNAYMRVDDVLLAACDTPEALTSAPVRGQVVDMAGWPIGGAAVSLVAGATSLGAATDAYGRFEFADVPAGSASLNAAASGYGAGVLRVVTVPGAPQEMRLPPASNAVANGGFESGLDNWQPSGATPPQTMTGGLSSHAVVLGDHFTPDPGHPDGNSTTSQQITVPDTSGVGLTFAYRMDTAELASGNDFFETLVIDGFQRTDVVNHLWHPSNGWTYRWVDLSPWRGRTITLIFNVYQSSADRPTRVMLDEVSVGGSQVYNLSRRLFLPLVVR